MSAAVRLVRPRAAPSCTSGKPPDQEVARHLPTRQCGHSGTGRLARSDSPRIAMPARLSWRHLIPGIIALAAVAAVALGVAMFAGIGRMRGDTMTLYASESQARGVLRGTEVWLAGQKIGMVDGVSFQPPTT